MEQEIKKNGLALGHILIHPIRYQIIKAIKEKKKLYINEIATILGIDRKVISFHLATLDHHGFVAGYYEVLKTPQSKGKAAKVFRLTPLVDQVLNTMIEVLEKN